MVMAAPLIPALLEAAGTAIATAWTAFVSSGAATAVAVSGTATVVILSIPEDSAKGKDKAETQVKTRTRKRECKCPPDKGFLGPVKHSMPELSAKYQQFVTGFPPGMEWIFFGRDFDGFQSSGCLLQEAKADYDQFMMGPGRVKSWWTGTDGAIRQAGAQNAIAVENPPSRLRWYFMTPMFFEWCTEQFLLSGYTIETELKSM